MTFEDQQIAYPLQQEQEGSLFPIGGRPLTIGASAWALTMHHSRYWRDFEYSLYKKFDFIKNHFNKHNYPAPGAYRPLRGIRRPPYSVGFAKGLYNDVFSAMTVPGAFFAMRYTVEEMNRTGAIVPAVAMEGAAFLGGRIGYGIGSRIGYTMGRGSYIGTSMGKFGGLMVGAIVGYYALDIIRKIGKRGAKLSMPDLGGNFYDTAASQTMRARSLNAIRTSQFNVRSELGNEAYRFVTGM